MSTITADPAGPLVEEMRGALHPYMRGLSVQEILHATEVALEKELAAAGRDSAMTRALTRGLTAREELKQAEGGSLSTRQAANRLALTHQAVNERYKKGRLLGWRETRQKAVRLPVWQFDEKDARLLPGLEEVLAILHAPGRLDDWGKILFFLQPRESLGGKRPLDLLRAGKTTRLAALAEAEVGD